QQPQQRRLAGAAGPGEEDEVSLLHGDVDVHQGVGAAAVVLVDVIQFDHNRPMLRDAPPAKQGSDGIRGALLLTLAALLCFSGLSRRDLWEPNEPIAAQAAREMASRGDWLLPTVNGEIYPDKPPL